MAVIGIIVGLIGAAVGIVVGVVGGLVGIAVGVIGRLPRPAGPRVPCRSDHISESSGW